MINIYIMFGFNFFKKNIEIQTNTLDFDYFINAAKRAKLAYLNPKEIKELWENKEPILSNAIECPIYI